MLCSILVGARERAHQRLSAAAQDVEAAETAALQGGSADPPEGGGGGTARPWKCGDLWWLLALPAAVMLLLFARVSRRGDRPWCEMAPVLLAIYGSLVCYYKLPCNVSHAWQCDNCAVPLMHANVLGVDSPSSRQNRC